MKRSGLGVCALMGVAVALALASCGRAGTKAPGGSAGGQPGEAEAGSTFTVVGDPGGYSTGASSSMAGAPVSVGPEGGAPGGGGYPSAERCEPGLLSCDGASVRECDADGAGTTIVETCSLSDTCVEGECIAIECAPGARSCRDGQVVECNPEGTGSDPIQSCKADEYCIEHDGSALCNATVCVADEPLCINQIATTCKPDGSGPEPGGQSCEAGSICDDGECVGTICTPGQRLCQHDDVYVCTSNGAGATLFFDCGAEETCDPELGACRPRLCEPGKLGCDESRVAQCNATGLGWEQSGTDCADSNEVCVAGSCKTQTCIPDSTFCKNHDVYLCDEHGVTSSLNQDCADGLYHCTPYLYGNSAYCTYNTCTPGAPMCNGNVLSQCADDGSGIEPGGTDCGDQICSNGACKTKVCTAGQYFCHDGDIAYCWDGVGYTIQQTCGDHARCDESGNGLECRPYACSPGSDACFGNRIGTCGDDGQSLSSVTQDCDAGGQVCSSDSSCGSSALDTLGISEELTSIGSDQVIGNVIDVTSDRELTLLEANLVLAGPRSLRWVIFELSGSYYEARYDKVIANQTGNGYLSSGAISYLLKAGRRYYIGVAVSGGGFVPYYDTAPFAPYLTFGRALGAFSTSYDTSLYAYFPSAHVFDLRFTTQAP